MRRLQRAVPAGDRFALPWGWHCAGAWRRAAACAVLLALCALGLPASSLAACTKVQPGWLWHYEGQMAGRHRIRMTLVFGPGEITGVYFYATQLKDIALRGRMLDATRVVLEELDSAGRPTARFEAEFPPVAPDSRYGSSPLQCEVLRGVWRREGAEVGLPVQLEMEAGHAASLRNPYAAIGARDPEALHRRAQGFWRAVRQDDRVGAAGFIRYPLRVDTAAGPRRYTSAEQLLADYELVFTPPLREAIAQGLPRNMFVRDQGAMLGHGQVWFGADGKVTALSGAGLAPSPPATLPAPSTSPSSPGPVRPPARAAAPATAPIPTTPLPPASDDPPALAALRKGMPPDVSDFIRRAVVCNHWAGEEPYDEERRAQINAAVQSLRCRALDADQAALQRLYAGQAEVLRRLKRARTTPL